MQITVGEPRDHEAKMSVTKHLQSLLAITAIFTGLAPSAGAQPATPQQGYNKRQVATSSRVVAAGAPVLVEKLASYVRVAPMNDGSLMASYSTEPDGTKDEVSLQLARSADGTGASWQFVGEILRGSNQTSDASNAFVVQFPGDSGERILCTYRRHDRVGVDAHIAYMLGSWQYTHHRIETRVSDDGGVTWSNLSTIAEDETYGLWEPFVSLGAGGNGSTPRVHVGYSKELGPSRQHVVGKTSVDGGESWSDETLIAGANGLKSRDGMISTAEVSGQNSTVVGVFEETEIGTFAVTTVKSFDGGLTWDPSSRQRVRTPVFTTNAQARAQAPCITSVGRTLVVAYQSSEDIPTEDTVEMDGFHLRFATSVDGGNTWSAPQNISDNSLLVKFPMVRGVNDTHLLLTYDLGYRMGAYSQLLRVAS